MPLFVVATPIGNTGDLSPRAREALASASLILCEDTRRTRKLLSACAIPAPPLWRCDAHREGVQVEAVITRLAADDAVVLVTDAGTPGVSDPGAEIVAAAHAAGHVVRVIPGPSAIIAAVSVAGFSTPAVHMLGFAPRKAGARERWIRDASALDGTLVILESGRRWGALVADLARLMPDREAVMCRELTKTHEEVQRAAVVDLSTEEQRGEIVVVIGPGVSATKEATALADGSLKEVARVLAQRWGCSRRAAYQRLLDLESESE